MFERLARGGMLRNADNGAGGSGGTFDAGGAGNAGAGNGTPTGNAENPTFDSWYAGADATVKGLVDGNTRGLKTALETERNERKTLQTQLTALQKTAEKGSDTEKQLAAMQATLTATERRAAFVEDAIRPEIGCVNIKAAYALAITDDLFDRQGRPDWNTLKATAPELFRRAGAGSADGGAGNNNPPRVGMNEIIRRAAGRG